MKPQYRSIDVADFKLSKNKMLDYLDCQYSYCLERSYSN